jgi:AcrR family transcriptional regulator
MTPSRVEAPRQRILDRALLLFNEKGYGATTMSDVRRAADVSNGSLYHFFPAKERLAAELYAEGFESFHGGFLDALQSSRTARSGIRATVRFHLAWIEGNAGVARFLVAEQDPGVLAAARDRVSALAVPFGAALRDWISQGVRDGQLRRLPPDLYYPLWMGPSQEASRQWLAGKFHMKLTDAERHLAAAAWQMLGVQT